MKAESDLRSYQHRMIEHIIDHPMCGLYADMGLGKTAVTLTAIKSLKRDFEVDKVLVVAPLRVARKTWTDEIEAWRHLSRQFVVSKILGTAAQRIKAIETEADIYLINRENFAWLCDQYRPKSSSRLIKPWPWDMLVIDESTSFKSRSSERWKSWRRIRTEIDRMVHLTGEPSPKGLKDLWAQVFMLDGGTRLGTSLGSFENRWFNRVMQHPRDQWGKLEPKPHAEEEIHRLVSDICVSLKADDYLDLPPVAYNWIKVEMSKAEMKQYQKMAKSSVLELRTKKITAVNAGVLAGKLLQLANGAAYTNHPEYEVFHNQKIQALEEILETAPGNVMIMCEFKSDYERIGQMISKKLSGKKWKILDTEQDEDDWNCGKIDYLLLHPASAGHGLNLQGGGEIIVWFGLNWSLELYDQANARLVGGHRRMGKNAIIHHLVAEHTYDERVRQVLEQDSKTQDDLMKALKMEMI